MKVTDFTGEDYIHTTEAFTALVKFKEASDYVLNRIEECILHAYLHGSGDNHLFKNKLITMYLSLSYEEQKEIIRIIDLALEAAEKDQEAKVIELHRKI